MDFYHLSKTTLSGFFFILIPDRIFVPKNNSSIKLDVKQSPTRPDIFWLSPTTMWITRQPGETFTVTKYMWRKNFFISDWTKSRAELSSAQAAGNFRTIHKNIPEEQEQERMISSLQAGFWILTTKID